MANDFSGDANCVALYTFEDDWPTNEVLNDSKGGNNMATQGGGAPAYPDRNTHGESSPPAEGTYAADFELGDTEYFDLVDGSLDAGFPGKSGTGNVDFSVCCWLKIESAVEGHMASKYDYGDDERSWTFKHDGASVVVNIGYNGGASQVSATHIGNMSTAQWYHVAVFYDDDGGGDSKGNVKIRVWDDNGSAILQSGGQDIDTTDIGQQMSVDSAPFGIGTRFNSDTANAPFDGLIDELPIFNDVLTEAEIDEIRAGTYGAVVGVVPQAYMIMRG